MNFNITNQPELEDPLLGFRFGVFFLGKVGIAHPLDFRFSKVSGLAVRTDPDTTGTVIYDPLILERGMPAVSTLRTDFLRNLQGKTIKKSNVLVSLMDEKALPISSWLFSNAFPVSWSLSPFDANSNEVVIERMELHYEKFSPFSL